MGNWVWTNTTGDNDASTVGNWEGFDGSSGTPSSSDLTSGDLFFRGSKSNTTSHFTLTSCKSINVESDYTATIEIQVNVSLEFASFKGGVLSAGSAKTLSFSNGSNLSSESTFVEFGDAFSYTSSSQRQNITFEITNTQSTAIKLSDGLYPKVTLVSGKFSTQYVTPNSSITNGKVDLYSLVANSGASFEKVAINTISVNDKDKHFYLKTSTLTINTATFHCGESKWTLQGSTSAATELPFFNSTITTFRMRNLILDNESGAGSMFKIPSGANMTLDSLTINQGVVLLATAGGIIRCSSKPTIKGSWGFVETSEGIYLPKDEEYLLGVNQGGTGLTSVGSAGQVLKSDGTVLYWDTTSAGSSSVIDIGPLTSSSTVYSKVVFGSLTV